MEKEAIRTLAQEGLDPREFLSPWLAEHYAAVEVALVAAALAVVVGIALALWVNGAGAAGGPTAPARGATWEQWDDGRWTPLPDSVADRAEESFLHENRATPGANKFWFGWGPDRQNLWTVDLDNMRMTGASTSGEVRSTVLRRVPAGAAGAAHMGDYSFYKDPSLEEHGSKRAPGDP